MKTKRQLRNAIKRILAILAPAFPDKVITISQECLTDMLYTELGLSDDRHKWEYMDNVTKLHMSRLKAAIKAEGEP